MKASNAVKVYGVLNDVVRPTLNAFVERAMKQTKPRDWMELIREAVSERAKSSVSEPLRLDLPELCRIIVGSNGHWREVFSHLLGYEDKTYIHELWNWRGKCAHDNGKAFTDENTYRALDTAVRVLRSIGAADKVKEVQQLRDQLLVAQSRPRNEEAARVLGRLVVEALKSEDTDLQYWARLAAQYVGPPVAPAIPQLLNDLGDYQTSPEAIKALASIGAAAVPGLRDFIEHRSYWEVENAIFALDQIQPQLAIAAAIPALIRVFTSHQREDDIETWEPAREYAAGLLLRSGFQIIGAVGGEKEDDPSASRAAGGADVINETAKACEEVLPEIQRIVDADEVWGSDFEVPLFIVRRMQDLIPRPGGG